MWSVNDMKDTHALMVTGDVRISACVTQWNFINDGRCPIITVQVESRVLHIQRFYNNVWPKFLGPSPASFV